MITRVKYSLKMVLKEDKQNEKHHRPWFKKKENQNPQQLCTDKETSKDPITITPTNSNTSITIQRNNSPKLSSVTPTIEDDAWMWSKDNWRGESDDDLDVDTMNSFLKWMK